MENLSKNQFLTKIVNYENSKKWDFGGNCPSLILFWKNHDENHSLLFETAEQLEKSFLGKVIFYTVDVEQETVLTTDLGIRKTPTWLAVPIHKRPFMIQGIPEVEEMQKIIETII